MAQPLVMDSWAQKLYEEYIEYPNAVKYLGRVLSGYKYRTLGNSIWTLHPTRCAAYPPSYWNLTTSILKGIASDNQVYILWHPWKGDEEPPCCGYYSRIGLLSMIDHFDAIMSNDGRNRNDRIS